MSQKSYINHLIHMFIRNSRALVLKVSTYFNFELAQWKSWILCSVWENLKPNYSELPLHQYHPGGSPSSNVLELKTGKPCASKVHSGRQCLPRVAWLLSKMPAFQSFIHVMKLKTSNFKVLAFCSQWRYIDQIQITRPSYHKYQILKCLWEWLPSLSHSHPLKHRHFTP